jgi:hypothetical protein
MARHSRRQVKFCSFTLLDEIAGQCVAASPRVASPSEEHLGGQCKQVKKQYLASAADFKRPCYGNWLPLVGTKTIFRISAHPDPQKRNSRSKYFSGFRIRLAVSQLRTAVELGADAIGSSATPSGRAFRRKGIRRWSLASFKSQTEQLVPGGWD